MNEIFPQMGKNVVNGSAANLVWAGDGAGNQWDVNLTSDWNNSGSSDTFFNLDKVTFDNFSANRKVNLNSTVQPNGVTVTGLQNYRIQGTGAIIGTGAFVSTPAASRRCLTQTAIPVALTSPLAGLSFGN